MTRLQQPLKPEMIFIHGFGGSAAHWGGVLAKLRGVVKTTTLDLPGHERNRGAAGPFTIESAARYVADRVPDKGAVLAGHSMGTRISLKVAALVPDRVRAMVLVDGSCPMPHALQSSCKVTERNFFVQFCQ